MEKWPCKNLLFRRAWWSYTKAFALSRSDMEDHRANYHFIIGICILKPKFLFGHWKPELCVWGCALISPDLAPWTLAKFCSTKCLTSQTTLSKKSLWRVRSTLESLSLPYPVFNKTFLYDCSLILASFLSRHTWIRGSPCCKDHQPGKATGPQLPLPWATWHQRPGQGCKMQIASLWMTENGIFDQKVFPNNHCITTF